MISVSWSGLKSTVESGYTLTVKMGRARITPAPFIRPLTSPYHRFSCYLLIIVRQVSLYDFEQNIGGIPCSNHFIPARIQLQRQPVGF